MIAYLRGRPTAEQQILRCNGFVLIVLADQYKATLISHSWRRSTHLCMWVCHNTHSISYSPVSCSKPNSSHSKHCFMHGSIWMPFPSVCYLLPCFHIRRVCRGLSLGKLERWPESCFRGLHSSCLFEPTHGHTSCASSQSRQPITFQDLASSVPRPGNQLINCIPFPADSLPSCHPVSVTLHCN